MDTLTTLVTIICAVRFLLDGVSASFFGHTFALGHMDPLAYGSFLTPVFAAHGYIQVKTLTQGSTSDDITKNNP